MPSYGIDSGIQDRVDAYSGNPDALAQRYQVGQELIDLLALQKIKSDKETAARQMQAQLAQQTQGQPKTVAEQRKNEVMDLTRAEVAEQFQGGMGGRQRQEEQMQQRMMQGIA